jgi:hypothetical protein
MAMEDENAHQSELSGLPELRKVWLISILNNYDVVLNPNNEILP